MKTSALTAMCYLILLSTASAPPPRPSQTPAPPLPQTPATTSAAATPAAPKAAPAATVPDYRLVPGDKLRIDVYKDQQLSQALQIRPDGKITMPLVGDIVAAGLTPTGLRNAIASGLKDYITDPVVTVIVVETTPQLVYVMGEVNAPGPQPIKGQLTVLQALAQAGGFKDFANTKDIKIRRQNSKGVQLLTFNYKNAIKGDGEVIVLQPGDTVIVP